MDNSTSAWPRLLDGVMSEEDAGSLLFQTADDLDAYLQAHPESQDSVMDILDKRLNQGINAQTWSTVHDSLSRLLGEDLSYLVSGVTQPSRRHYMQQVENHAGPQVVALLRRISALHGPELEEAVALWNERPDDWRNLHREVYYDRIAGRYWIQLRIEKYGGEEVVIQGSANSILNLTSALLLSVRLVGDAGAFDARTVERFAEEVDAFRSLLRGTATQEEEESAG